MWNPEIFGRKQTLYYLKYLRKWKSIQGNINDMNRITNEIKKRL